MASIIASAISSSGGELASGGVSDLAVFDRRPHRGPAAREESAVSPISEPVTV
jgi:hypothetical protein